MTCVCVCVCVSTKYEGCSPHGGFYEGCSPIDLQVGLCAHLYIRCLLILSILFWQALRLQTHPHMHLLTCRCGPSSSFCFVIVFQDCWSEDVLKRPRFEDIIISLRGLLESANNRHKLQKTLTGEPQNPNC